VAPDQRGYSRGARPPEPDAYGTQRLVDDVTAVSDALGMKRFDLVGHDWGGLLGWLVASRRPERVRTLAVVSTPHPLALREALDGDEVARSAAGRSVAQLVEPHAEQRMLEPDGSGGNLDRLLTGSGLDEEHARIYVEAMREPGALSGALNWFRAMDPGVLDALEPVGVPTLYVWSTGDRAFGRQTAERSARHVRASYRFEVLEDVPHWIPERAPERFCALLLDHLLAH
jgi:pimeloyl-ACP methyl ester carboxylesterase